MRRICFASTLLVFLRAATCWGLEPMLTAPGKELLSLPLTGASLPKEVSVRVEPEAFRMGEEGLEMAWHEGEKHTPLVAVKTSAKDLSIGFAVKFVKPAVFYVNIDGHSEAYGGNAHLVRFWLSGTQFVWDQKRGGPESKKEVGAAMVQARENRLKAATPTPEQLADPDFFRTENLGTKTAACAEGVWHQVLLELNGNELVAQVDGQALAITSTVADAMKSRVGFALTGRGTVVLRDLRISENARRADWAAVKGKLGR